METYMSKYDLETIKALAEIMKDSGLTSLSLKYDDEEISLERGSAAPVVQTVAAPAAAPTAAKAAEPDGVDGTPVKCPMVGVFYAAPAPDEKPYVQVGDKVKKGDVLCIIEAMKLMNEITAEQDGEIARICVEDGELIEYGQALFILK